MIQHRSSKRVVSDVQLTIWAFVAAARYCIKEARPATQNKKRWKELVTKSAIYRKSHLVVYILAKRVATFCYCVGVFEVA